MSKVGIYRMTGFSAVLLLAFAVLPARPAAAQEVGLGTADSFAVLAGSTVTNTGPSIVTGDVGVAPGTAITGFPPGIVVGAVHSADAVAAQAQADLVAAYNDAAGRVATPLASTELGGQVLNAGVYSGPTLAITGTLTLSGDADDIWVFQAGSTLITGSDSSVNLVGGASACNVSGKWAAPPRSGPTPPSSAPSWPSPRSA